MRFWKCKRTKSEKTNGCQEFKGRKEWWNKGDLFSKGSETILYDTVMADLCNFKFANTHGIFNKKAEP